MAGIFVDVFRPWFRAEWLVWRSSKIESVWPGVRLECGAVRLAFLYV
jgi:hypothetical protein